MLDGPTPLPRDPTLALLVAGARVRADEAARARLRAALAGEIAWDKVINLAHQHRVLPLLYEHLKGEERVPERVAQRLRRVARHAAGHNLLLTAELLALLAALAEAGIVALPYKGPALAALAYGSVALRPCHDLDLLVQEAQVAQATAVLEARGYRRVVPVGPAWEAALMAVEREWRLVDERRDLTVELNWGAIPAHLQARLDLAAMWERARPLSLAGRNVPGLGHEDLLILLCWHGAKHLWQELGWIVDVAEIVRAVPALDWTAVQKRAAAAGSQRVLNWGLALAGNLLDAPLPPEVKANVAADSEAGALATAVAKHLFDGRATRGVKEPLFHPYYWRMQEHAPDRLRYLRDILFRPNRKDWMWVKLPRQLGMLYYGLRPIRLVGHYLGALRQR